MAYATGNPKTKKALKELVSTKKVYVFTPNGMFPDPKSTDVTIEGPHYPEAHK